MTRALVLSLVLLAGFGCDSPSQSHGAESSAGETPQARAMVEAGAVLLDVRTTGEVAGGYIRGAINIPIGELEGRIGELEQGTPVVVYCRSGARSSAAARMLTAAGYEVHDLGGMNNWDQSSDIVR